MTRWWWVRHAPVAWAGVYIYGHTDLDCDTGDGQAFATLAARLPAGAVAVRSHLGRTRRTAEAIAAAGLTLAEPLIEPGLAEQGFGVWEGASWNGLAEAKDPHLDAFWAAPFETRPPGGESFRDVIARVAEVVGRLTADHPGRDIIAVAHAGSIRAALTVALGLTPDQAHAIALEPLSLTMLEHAADTWTVRGVNVPSLATALCL